MTAQAASAQPPQVVIVGGGFGGLFAARALRDAPCEVTLVDRATEHVFQPLLYQCATGILSEGQITAPLRRLFRKQPNLECVCAEAINVDPARRRLICLRPIGEVIEIPYDHLIVAAGVQQSYFGHDEFADWAPGMKTISDALTIRRRVLGAFEMAETAANASEQEHWLTFALVGAGPTGVELAGQIREVATKTLSAEYRRVQPEDARVVLFDGGPAPLASFGPRLSGRATQTLRDLGVELQMNSIVTSVDGNGLVARDKSGNETRLDAATVLWTAGVEAPPFAAALADATGAERDRCGRIAVRDDLTIDGHPEISVIGDMMTLRKLPGVAEVAMQAGFYTGRRIKRLLTGQSSAKRFKYYDLGSAAYISRGRAVVSAGRLHLSGLPGWFAWLFIHIAFLTGYRNRLGAILTWWIAFTRDVRRERAFTTRAVGRVQDIFRPGEVPAQRGGENQAEPLPVSGRPMSWPATRRSLPDGSPPGLPGCRRMQGRFARDDRRVGVCAPAAGNERSPLSRQHSERHALWAVSEGQLGYHRHALPRRH
jgi:NADH:ubiquinone reductase (H+-translocating)